MKFDIVRAWKDEAYRQDLNPQQLDMLPTNPIGELELTEADLLQVSGGCHRPHYSHCRRHSRHGSHSPYGYNMGYGYHMGYGSGSDGDADDNPYASFYGGSQFSSHSTGTPFNPWGNFSNIYSKHG